MAAGAAGVMRFLSDPEHSGFSRLLAALTYLLAGVVALGAPLGYLAVRYAGESRYLEHIAKASAEDVSEVVYAHPGTWRSLGSRYSDLLERNQDRGDIINQTLVSAEGEELVRFGVDFGGVAIERHADITDGRGVLGRVVVRARLFPVFQDAVPVVLLAFCIAVALVIALRMPWRLHLSAMKEISSSRETLRRVFGGMPDALFVVTRETGKILDFNGAGLTLTCRNAPALASARIQDLFDAEEAKDALVSVLGEGKDGQAVREVGVFPLGRPDGSRSLVVATVIHLRLDEDRSGAVVILQDITEREKALEAVRESERRYRGFVESFEGIAFRIRADSSPEFFHGAVRGMTGYGEEDLLNSSPDWEQLVHAEDLEERRKGDELLLTVPGHSTERDYRIVRRDGAVRVVREISHNVVDADGKPMFVEGLILDITERREERERLRLSEEQFRMIGLSAQDAIVVVDDETIISFWNRAAEKIFGYGVEEAIGMELGRIVASERAEDDLRESLTRFHEMHSDRDESAARVFEMAGVRKSGGRFPIELSVAGVREDDRWNSVMVIRDISARKRELNMLQESEERFRRVFEESDDAIVLLDPETCLVMEGNPKAADLFGCEGEDLRERSLEEYLAGEDYERMCQGVRQHWETRSFELEEHLRVGEQGDTLLSVRGRVIGLKGKQVLYCVLRDTTEQVRLAENWRLSLERLVQAEKMAFLGTMVSGFAHDVNNPNQLIALNLELVRDAWADAVAALEPLYAKDPGRVLAGMPYEKAREVVGLGIEDMGAGAKRISDIVNNLLAFAKEDRPEHEEDVNVNDAVRDALALIRHKIRKSTDRFRFVEGAEIPLCRGNKSQIERVVVNLVMNALDALPDRSRGVEVSTEYDNRLGRILVHVFDEGQGMPEEVRSRVTEPFFTTKHGKGGTGLGLAITDMLVKEHGGELIVESEEGTGTTVTVSFACIH